MKNNIVNAHIEVINDTLKTHINNLQNVLVNDSDTLHYILNELMNNKGKYSEAEIKNFVATKYANLDYARYHKLLSAVAHLHGLLHNHHPLISDIIDTTTVYFTGNVNMIHDIIVCKYKELCNFTGSTEEIKLFGEQMHYEE